MQVFFATVLVQLLLILRSSKAERFKVGALQARAVVSISFDAADLDPLKDPVTLKQRVRDTGYTGQLPFARFANDITAADDDLSSSVSQSNPIFILDDSPIKTRSKSTTLKGDTSYTNTTTKARRGRIVALTFSNGDAACASCSAQRATTISSSGSSGTGNSTNICDATGEGANLRVFATGGTQTIAANATGSAQDAISVAACAAPATGASARGVFNTTYTFPIGRPNRQPSKGMTSRGFCEAGLAARQGDTGPGWSSSSVVLARKEVASMVTCGVGSSAIRATSEPRYIILIRGIKPSEGDFVGRLLVREIQETGSSCM